MGQPVTVEVKVKTARCQRYPMVNRFYTSVVQYKSVIDHLKLGSIKMLHYQVTDQ